MTLMELLILLRRKWYLCVLFPIFFALLAGVYAYGFMPNTYTSSVSMYVLGRYDSTSETTATSSELAASQQMVNDISVMAKSVRVRRATAEALGMESLAGYGVSVGSSTTNRVISLSVTGRDPETCALIADELADQASIVAKEAMELKNIYVIDSAAVPMAPSGPNRPMYVMVALLAGLFVAVALIVLLDMLDRSLRSGDEAEELLGLPMLGTMPYVKSLR